MASVTISIHHQEGSVTCCTAEADELGYPDQLDQLCATAVRGLRDMVGEYEDVGE